MTGWAPALIVALTSGLVARLVAPVAIANAPGALTRTNVDGDEVPAVLAWALVAGACGAALATGVVLAMQYRDSTCAGAAICADVLVLIPWQLAWIPLIPVVGMFVAGTWDDLRGDERPRGFSGHLAAARGGAITGGLVKLVGGAAIALATIAALNGWAPPSLGDWVLFAAPVALGANLINLLDRAPGRALKVFVAATLPLVVFVPSTRVLAAGSLGAAVALLPADLKAKGMLGDAGANPLGAILGLSFVVAAVAAGDGAWSRRGLAALVALVLLALNLASEKWSFSQVIRETPWLARLDHLGRK